MSAKQQQGTRTTPQQRPRSGVEPDLDALRIAALDVSTWPAFADLVERHVGIFGGCWCTFFGPDCDEKRQSYEGNRALKRRWVEEGTTHAALVMDGEEAVGWAEFGPPEELPNLHHKKQYLAEQQEPPDFRVTCIFVDRRYRRHGVAELALRGALDLIAAAGGGVVEGYPHDLDGRRMSASFVYNGTRRMYERAGFTYDRPKGKGNCVMVREVAAAG